MFLRISASLCILFLFSTVIADTPANCHGDDVLGTWALHMTDVLGQYSADCPTDRELLNVTEIYYVTLTTPDLAVDDRGNRGFWTMVYNQGFEIRIRGMRFFGFSNYTTNAGIVTSHCGMTDPLYYHNDPSYGIPPEKWGCYFGALVDEEGREREREREGVLTPMDEEEGKERFHHPEYLSLLSSLSLSWTQNPRTDLSHLSVAEVMKMHGLNRRPARYEDSDSPKSVMQKLKREVSKITKNIKKRFVANDLPTAFDWRNVSGISYSSPMRDQLSCGSCYAFASVGMFESRARILSNSTRRVELSPQDIVSCSRYSQGCDGGFPFLVAKYAQDFGLAEELCFPYDSGIINADFGDGEVECNRCSDSSKYWRAKDYDYVGGYYGACTEEGIMREVISNGPVAVSMEVYPDLMHYQSGIYRHVDSIESPHSSFFEVTNHVVVIFGWGVDSVSGEKYWIVRNSWGYSFGESGFFYIVRGEDNCAIESMAVHATPIAPEDV